MISYNENEAQKLIEITVSGNVTKRDFENVLMKMEPRIEQWNEIRLIETIDHFESMDFEAFIEDMKFGFKHLKDMKNFKKCAVVADEKWIRAITKTMDPLFDAELKGFDRAHHGDAREWVLQ